MILELVNILFKIHVQSNQHRTNLFSSRKVGAFEYKPVKKERKKNVIVVNVLLMIFFFFFVKIKRPFRL